MANGHGFDPEARHAQLTERVENQGSRINHLEAVVTRGFSDMNSQLNNLANDLRSGSKTQWPVIWSAMGVCFAILFGIGGALYWPVREQISETKSDVRAITASSLSVAAFLDFKNTYENNRVVSRNEYIDKFNNIGNSLDTVRKDQVPRAEIERILSDIDRRFEDHQRQLDDNKNAYGGIVTPRDVLLKIQRDLDAQRQDRP